MFFIPSFFELYIEHLFAFGFTGFFVFNITYFLILYTNNYV